MRSENQQQAEYCMRAAGQTVSTAPRVPTASERELRCKLVLEEAFELCEAMGVTVFSASGVRINPTKHNPLELLATGEVDWAESVDACCDLNVVSAGTMSCLGADDVPHMTEVNRANRDKFPNGKATLRADGKFLKPEGWRGPDHMKLISSTP